jgi:DNA-directed RNA polymerase specialized sigma24 family protein
MGARPRRGQRGGIEQNACSMSAQEFEEFYRRVFLPLARRVRWRYRLSREDAWDIVQDAFLIALAKIDSARNPKAWMIQVVDHLALNYQWKTLRRTQLAAAWLDPNDSDAAAYADRIGPED